MPRLWKAAGQARKAGGRKQGDRAVQPQGHDGARPRRRERNAGEGQDPAPRDLSNSERRGTKEAQLSFAFHRRAGS